MKKGQRKILIMFCVLFAIVFSSSIASFAGQSEYVSDVKDEIEKEENFTGYYSEESDNSVSVQLETQKQKINAFLIEYKTVIMGFLGFVDLTCALVLAYSFFALGAPQMVYRKIDDSQGSKSRRDAVYGILISGIGLMVCGSITLIYGILVNTAYVG